FEVGLGGRLDATNVIEPQLTAITSIAFDHERYLGSTLADIAGEKAGIIKPRVPVVVGELAPEALMVIDNVARQLDAPVIQAMAGVQAHVVANRAPALDEAWGATTLRLRTPTRDYGEVRIGLRGTHQITNAIVAVRMLELLDAQGTAVPRDAVMSALAE